MTDFQIYHNPRCSKSRQTLALLTERGIEPKIILYLATPPTEAELTAVLTKLNLTPRQLLRTGEADYKTLALKNSEHTDAALIAFMCQYPKLIERPIVIQGEQAKLGRPPESVLELLA